MEEESQKHILRDVFGVLAVAGGAERCIPNEFVVFAVALAVQLAGLTSIALARLGQQRASQLRYKRFFFACLALVAVISLLAICTGEGFCMMNGMTLTMMAVGATIDTRSAQATDSGL